MQEVIVFGEGHTEEQFIKRVVAPSLRSAQIYIKPQLLKTSQNAKGGAFNFDRLKLNARNTLRQKPDAMLTTLIDLYALDTSFPGFLAAKNKPDLYDRVASLEAALHKEIVEYVECRPERFIPYIQPFEFEGLLFSNVEILTSLEPRWCDSLTELSAVRNEVQSPEHINDGPETAPSKRLGELLIPKYKKTRHGPLAAERITLAVIEKECMHFHGWMEKLRGLGEG